MNNTLSYISNKSCDFLSNKFIIIDLGSLNKKKTCFTFFRKQRISGENLVKENGMVVDLGISGSTWEFPFKINLNSYFLHKLINCGRIV